MMSCVLFRKKLAVPRERTTGLTGLRRVARRLQQEMALAPLSKYNFYHPSGDGRDSMIMHVSAHQTGFSYTPKAPEMPGTRQPGMASNTVGLTKLAPPAHTYAASGYTGLTPGDRGPPTSPDAFPNLGPKVFTTSVSKATVSMVKDWKAAESQHLDNIAMASYRMPGYGGHLPNHHQVCGFTQGAVCCGDAGTTKFAAIGFDAPGLNAGEQKTSYPNLQPGAVWPAGAPRTKSGYTGHFPGKYYSSNFGKQFSYTVEELIPAHGQPKAGGIGDPCTPFNVDTEKQLAYPAGHLGRPPKVTVANVGYAGYRPRTTPGQGWDAPAVTIPFVASKKVSS